MTLLINNILQLLSNNLRTRYFKFRIVLLQLGTAFYRYYLIIVLKKKKLKISLSIFLTNTNTCIHIKLTKKKN